MAIENRRIRFATIDGLRRDDLPLAMEIWRDDLRSQVWTSRDMLKLATLFVRYMADARPEHATLSYIERTCQLDRMQIRQCLKQLQAYGAVEAFGLDGDDLKVAISLSILQRLRVLRCRKELAELVEQRAVTAQPLAVSDAPDWLPEASEGLLDDEAEEHEVPATATAFAEEDVTAMAS